MHLAITKTRILLVLNDHISRAIPLEDLEAITLSEKSSEFILHIVNDEDERLSSPESRTEILELLLYLITNKNSNESSQVQKLPMYFINEINLEIFRTTLEDVESGTSIRPDKKYLVQMDYETFLLRIENHKEERKLLKKRTSTIFSKNKLGVTVDDFELLKLLGKGAHGKVLLCEKKGGKGQLYAMKIIKKKHIIEAKQLEHTKAENLILCNVNNSFLVSLKYAFQTEQKIYFVMEFMKGGELFQHLRRVFKFKEEQAKFFAACIVMALGHLHNKNYIYRDLKPENILLDERGYAKLTDFGLAKSIKVQDLATTFCGTPEYLAPEMILGKGCNRPADWWSLGILVYEMIYGIPPFYCEGDAQAMYKKTVFDKLKFKSDTKCSNEAKDFIAGLLEKNPEKRLGSIADSLEVMNHPWFKDFDWFNLVEKKLKPPYDPLTDSNWLKNFDSIFTKQPATDSICYLDPKILESYQSQFDEFKQFSAEAEESTDDATTPLNVDREKNGVQVSENGKETVSEYVNLNENSSEMIVENPLPC